MMLVLQGLFDYENTIVFNIDEGTKQRAIVTVTSPLRMLLNISLLSIDNHLFTV